MTEPEGPGQIYAAARPALDRALIAYTKVVDVGITSCVDDFYISGRVKTARSLIRKMRKSPESPRSWQSIQDKVGLRIICSTKADVRKADRWLGASMSVIERTVKSGKHDQLFYPGVHYIVQVADVKDHIGVPIPCEIQIRTRAQDAWSAVSHKLLYKGLIEPPKRMKRVISRLTVVVEMFDDEVHRMMKKRSHLPEYRPASMLETLDGRYTELVGEPSDELADLDMMLILSKAYVPDEYERFDQLIAEYCSTSEPDLVALLEQHQPSSETYVDSSDWLYTQPEILLVLERAHSRPYLLCDAIRDTDIELVIRRSCVAAGMPLPVG